MWNAAQRQLKSEGWFHGYLRMLWGKKLFEWAPDAPTALTWMEALMNRYSLDGRDPVSYAGFAWVLGRYDRPWPRRPIFGTLRYMSSESARRKLRMKKFLQKYSSACKAGSHSGGGGMAGRKRGFRLQPEGCGNSSASTSASTCGHMLCSSRRMERSASADPGTAATRCRRAVQKRGAS